MDDITKYIQTMNKLQNAINPPVTQAIQAQNAAIQNALSISPGIQKILDNSNGMYAALNTLAQNLGQQRINNDVIGTALSSMTYVSSSFRQQQQIFSNLTTKLQPLLNGYTVLSVHPQDRDIEEQEETDQISEKIISEIYLPDEKKIITAESPTITILPANDKIFAYLAEHPEEIYRNLSPREFEEFMARLYNKLGYNVELTQTTRDGGKDIILRKPDVLGNMIYYVECKRYKEKNKVGLDVVQRLTGIVETDKVNGGIIATTSYLSPSAERWIIENRYNYKIQMHNFKTIQNMLKMTVA